jgi:Zn-dependent protease
MAKRYNISTKDIIISPIGGVARLKSLPDNPRHEIMIAIAGPLVNVALAIACILVVILFGYTQFGIPEDPFAESFNLQHFILNVGIINLVLFVFNMIPAFPMDGGRVMRALLSFKFGKLKATRYATVIGTLIAVVFLIICFLSKQYTLGMIAVFIFISANAEYQSLKKNAYLNELSVRDVMRKSYTKIHIGDAYSLPASIRKNTKESNFLVFDSLEYIVGCIPEIFIDDVIKSNKEEEKVSSLLSNAWGKVNINSTLQEVYTIMREKSLAIMAITDEETIVGVVDQNTFLELVK